MALRRIIKKIKFFYIFQLPSSKYLNIFTQIRKSFIYVLSLIILVFSLTFGNEFFGASIEKCGYIFSKQCFCAVYKNHISPDILVKSHLFDSKQIMRNHPKNLK